jgi:GTP cyclohydrolase I
MNKRVLAGELARGEAPAEDAVTRILQAIGEDPTREGLLETPKRVMKAWMEWTEGYRMNLDDIIKVFNDGAEGVDEMVIVKGIPFTSHCEHHMAPFTGHVTIAYIPKNGILGLSKFNRVTEMFSKRLQVQERMTTQIAGALEDRLKPLGVAVLVEAEHTCVCSRGIRHHGCTTVTSALRGAFKTQPETRAEFYALAK